MQHNFILANGDTDSIAFKKPDQSPFTPEEQEALLKELNALMPPHIVWKNDKHYRRFIVFAAKNYALDDGKKVKIKGNSIKATKKGPALRRFIREVVDALLADRKSHVFWIYLNYAKQILELTDIAEWCFKVTVTKSVLEPKVTFQKKILAAIGNTPVREGDKIYCFYKPDESICLRENFTGEFCRDRLLKNLYDSLNVFGRVLDTDLFPNFATKKGKELLASLSITTGKVEKKTKVSTKAAPVTLAPPQMAEGPLVVRG